ncbi:muscarinic acetylcholine receptor M5b [Synchiropus picturatus]
MDLPNVTLGNGSQLPVSPHSLWEVIAIASASAAVSLVTVVGNVLVMLSFKVNSQLKTVNNYYLLSLAFADLIIGVLSMNLYTSYILMGYWSLGSLACDLWLAVDYVASNASVMNLLVISFDRYFSITRPLTYRAKRTPKRAAVMIGLAWLVSLVLWAPPILCWHYFVGEKKGSVHECEIQFLTEPVITFGTAIAAFYIPVSVMTILYCRIYKETQRRSQDLAELQGLSRGPVPEGKKGRGPLLLRSCFRFGRERREPSQASWSSSNQSNVTKSTGRSHHIASFNSYTSSDEDERHVSTETPQGSFKDRNGQAADPPPRGKKCVAYTFRAESQGTKGGAPPEGEPSHAPPPSRPPEQALKSQITKRKRMVLVKEKKAAQTLSAILLAFILTWTPYNIMVLVSTFCATCIPKWLWHLGYWLCYVNSTVNPMCYALCNKTFQKTFRMLLLCQWRRRRRGQDPNNKMT